MEKKATVQRDSNKIYSRGLTQEERKMIDKAVADGKVYPVKSEHINPYRWEFKGD